MITTKILSAVFDGEILRPDEPLGLIPNTRVERKVKFPENGVLDREQNDPVEKFFGAMSLGYPTGTDNESIDADLSRKYGDPNELSINAAANTRIVRLLATSKYPDDAQC